MTENTLDPAVVQVLAEVADRHNFVVDDGGPGECSWRCACTARSPRFVSIEQAWDDAKRHVATAQAAALAQAQAPDPAREALARVKALAYPAVPCHERKNGCADSWVQPDEWCYPCRLRAALPSRGEGA